MVEVINFIFGIIFTVLLFFSALSVKRKNIVILQLGVVLCVFVPYILLNSWGSVVIVAGVLIRQIVALLGLKYENFNHKGIVACIICLQILLFFYVSYEFTGFSFIGFIPLVASIFNTVAIFMQDILKLKIGYIIGGSLWLVNEYVNGLYGQMVGESMNLLFTVASVFWILSFRKKGVNDENIPAFNIRSLVSRNKTEISSL